MGVNVAQKNEDVDLVAAEELVVADVGLPARSAAIDEALFSARKGAAPDAKVDGDLDEVAIEEDLFSGRKEATPATEVECGFEDDLWAPELAVLVLAPTISVDLRSQDIRRGF